MAGDGAPPDAAAIDAVIFSLLAERAPGATICPSEVARQLAPVDWRALMPDVRAAAWALVAAARLEVRQRGRAVTRDTIAPGPIRLARPGGG